MKIKINKIKKTDLLALKNRRNRSKNKRENQSYGLSARRNDNAKRLHGKAKKRLCLDGFEGAGTRGRQRHYGLLKRSIKEEIQ